MRAQRGKWYSKYDDLYVQGLDIDHRVPLGKAWKSGAFAWSARSARRTPTTSVIRALIAVTGSSNRAKGKKDSAEWQPSYAGSFCTYNADWGAVKTRWDQSVDPTEKTALAEQLSRCPNSRITVTRAR